MVIDCVRMTFHYYNEFFDRDFKIIISHAFKSIKEASEWIKDLPARQAEARQSEICLGVQGVPEDINKFLLEDFTDDLMPLT